MAGAGATRGESNPPRRDCEGRRANHETTFTDYSRAAKARIRTAPQRECFDTHDLRRGFDAVKKTARRHSESASTRTISAEGSPSSRQVRRHSEQDLRVRREQDKFARRHNESADTHDRRRGFAETKTHSHGATARALRHARSPQRGAFRKLPSGLPPARKRRRIKSREANVQKNS